MDVFLDFIKRINSVVLKLSLAAHLAQNEILTCHIMTSKLGLTLNLLMNLALFLTFFRNVAEYISFSPLLVNFPLIRVTF